MSVSSPSNSSQSSLSSSDSQLPITPPNLHQNTISPCSKWLVQKYGGTSVGKHAVKIARDIVSNYLDQHKVAIVCSARSGSTKELGTTNLLFRAASQALPKRQAKNGAVSGAMTPITRGMLHQRSGSPPGSPLHRTPSLHRSPSPGISAPLTNMTPIPSDQTIPEFYATVDLIQREHLDAAKASVRDPDILRDLEADIEQDCEWLRSFLFAAQVIDEITPRSKDNIIGLGERLACKIMTAVLRDQGIDAEYVSLESIVPDVVDTDDFNDRTLDQDFYDRMATALRQRIQQCSPKVPVITGFFGSVPGSLLSQVGRGYTDLVSGVLSVALQAAELQIWKEVDGIFTADPRKVPTARLIPVISPEEAAEMTYYGSEVVHPFAMEQAIIRGMIPIRIKNVENPNGGGTVIHPSLESGDQWLQKGTEPVSKSSPLELPNQLSVTPEYHSCKKLPTAVTIKEHIIVLNVNSNRKSVSHGFLAGIFGTLDRFGIVVDLISTSEVHVSMAIADGPAKKFVDRLVNDLRKSGSQVSVHHDMAILSLVGKHMRNMVGIAGLMFTTLARGNVNIEMISQGASEINISCVIQGRDAVKALNLIHQSCLPSADLVRG